VFDLPRAHARASRLDQETCARREAQLVVAARTVSSAAARLFLLAYVTGAVLLLPGLIPPDTAASVSASAPPRSTLEATASWEVTGVPQQAAVAAVRRATVDRTEPPQVKTHEVVLGESLEAIAERYGVHVETVAYNNGLRSRTELIPGATLTIPPFDGAVYTVREGDTVETIAQRFGADVKAVMDANRLYFEPHNLSPGKTILVPVASARYPDFELAPPAVVARARPIARAATLAAPPAAGRLSWPVAGTITQHYHGYHLGVDIAAPYGAPLAASDAGTVSAVGWVALGGLRVCVRHESALETCYYHTSAVYVSVGQAVERGQVIAAIGLTGTTTGPHVHWEANRNGVLVNPLGH
jgi:murein DD-endopeptidase MepM/ murein hydrolase activator NlpD